MVKKVAIIGANGFLGKSLTKRLLDSGFSVLAVYHTTKIENQHNNLQCLSWLEFLRGGYTVDAIVYAASIIPYGNMGEYSEAMLETNALNVLKIKALYPQSHFIYISSVSVYATSTEILAENAPLLPIGAYAESKLAGEILSKGFENWSILRCSSIFGKGMKESTFIPRCIQQARETGVITLFGDGSRSQNYIHVDDVAQCCLQIIENRHMGIYLSVYPKSFSNYEIALAVSALYHAKIIRVGEDKSPSYFYNADKTYACLGFTPSKQCVTEIYEC